MIVAQDAEHSVAQHEGAQGARAAEQGVVVGGAAAGGSHPDRRRLFDLMRRTAIRGGGTMDQGEDGEQPA